MSTMPMKLQPWQPPNFARLEMPPGNRQEGFKETPALHVSELSQDALDGLASQWLTDLYAKAEKPNNWALAKAVSP